MRRLLALLLLLLSGTAYGHNGLEHVMGTVAKVSGNSLDVKTVAGKTTTVMLDATTHWMKGSAAASANDVRLGDRVVVHAKPVGGKLAAVEVAIGTAATVQKKQ